VDKVHGTNLYRNVAPVNKKDKIKEKLIEILSLCTLWSRWRPEAGRYKCRKISYEVFDSLASDS